MLRFKRVAVGISGGVDSAVAALLLKKRGYEVQGVFMQNWDIRDEMGVCTAEEDFKDAQYICNKLNIGLTHVNFVKEYWNEVFTNLIKEYENGLTPNPDVLCNKKVKFNHFYKYCVEKMNVDCLATGHYARTSFGDYLEHYKEDQMCKLLRPLDKDKDQTFFLCQINQEALRRTMFPLGSSLIKKQVKQLAKENGLEKIANKKESMGICFIGTRNFQDFISNYIEEKEGDFVDIDTGKIVGRHKGIHQWTLGQRSKLQGLPEAYFIAKKDINTNTIYVAMGTNHPALFSKQFFTESPHWIASTPQEIIKGDVLNCRFTFQHTHDLVDCNLIQTSKGLIVRLSENKRALTEGQFAVFYNNKDKNEECLGSAKITGIGPTNYALNWLENQSTNK